MEPAGATPDEAMLRLWRIASDWEGGRARLATWLYRVTANLATDRLRRRRPTAPLALIDTLPDPAAPVEAGLGAQDRAAALATALARLPERQRLAIVLRHLEERCVDETAAIMGLSAAAAESLLARGRRALAAELLPRRDDLGFPVAPPRNAMSGVRQDDG